MLYPNEVTSAYGKSWESLANFFYLLLMDEFAWIEVYKGVTGSVIAVICFLHGDKLFLFELAFSRCEDLLELQKLFPFLMTLIQRQLKLFARFSGRHLALLEVHNLELCFGTVWKLPYMEAKEVVCEEAINTLAWLLELDEVVWLEKHVTAVVVLYQDDALWEREAYFADILVLRLKQVVIHLGELVFGCAVVFLDVLFCE